ncbi:hypothetical protein HDU98_007935 [Podochytrium sp. JEL0797]|nr:hypothetical protein HDU98_007935 [Podochytrium sp. JEL0797]
MGRNAKFTKRLTKKEKDTLRVASNSGTSKKIDSGYDHDTKATMKAAAKALGAKPAAKSSGGIKTTLGPSGGLVGGFSEGSSVKEQKDGNEKPDSLKAVFGLLNKQVRKSVARGGMDIDVPVERKPAKKETKEYVTAGMVDYVDLMNSRNPKKLLQKRK